MISRAGRDMATLRLRDSLGQQRGVAALTSQAEGGQATLRYSWAEGGKTDSCSWTEKGHLETSSYSSSINPTLSLLQGRREERKEMDDMTTRGFSAVQVMRRALE